MIATESSSSSATGWHQCWEERVYAKGRHLNLYPYHAVVGFLISRYGRVADRSAVRILELGFGAGNNLWFAAREGFSVAGIEGSPTAVSFARERFAAEGLTGDLRRGSFERLDWPADSFDAVIDRASLAHTRRAVIEAALDETRRVLKPGGSLFSMMYSDEHPGRAFGRHLGDNTYDAIDGGYFNGLGTVHFAPRVEIFKLFGGRFTITSLVHTREEDELEATGAVNAFWKVECLKKS